MSVLAAKKLIVMVLQGLNNRKQKSRIKFEIEWSRTKRAISECLKFHAAFLALVLKDGFLCGGAGGGQ